MASLNEKPHDEHETASGEISRWQRGQFTGGGLYHWEDWGSSLSMKEDVSEPPAAAGGPVPRYRTANGSERVKGTPYKVIQFSMVYSRS